jgi:hypothetical protein
MTHLGHDECGDPGESGKTEGVAEASQPGQQVEDGRQLGGGVEVLRQQQTPRIAVTDRVKVEFSCAKYRSDI